MAWDYVHFTELEGFKLGDVVPSLNPRTGVTEGDGKIVDLYEKPDGRYYATILDNQGYKYVVNVAKMKWMLSGAPLQREKEMNVSKVTYSKGLTLNTGNYNSLRLDVLLEISLEQGDSVAKAFQYARAEANAQLEIAIMDTDLPEPVKLTHVAQLRKDK